MWQIQNYADYGPAALDNIHINHIRMGTIVVCDFDCGLVNADFCWGRHMVVPEFVTNCVNSPGWWRYQHF